MASSKKLNPNALPYPIFPHSIFTARTIPVPFQPVSLYYQTVPNLGFPYYPHQFHSNVNIQANQGFDFVEDGGFKDKAAASNTPKSAEEGRKLRNLPPRFGGKEKMISGGGKVQQWKPKNIPAEKRELIKKEMNVNFGREKSLMIRNIPNRLQRNDLMQILDEHCLEVNKNKTIGKSAYDFLYLPMDFRTGGNLGYAFVNFTNSAGAMRFFKAFDNYQWDVPVNKKTCKVCYANIQGKVALSDHFKHSVFICSQKDYLPVVLTPPRDGVVSSRVNVIGKFREKPML